MIADHRGDQGRVYHKYKSKNDIVLALTDRELASSKTPWRPQNPNAAARYVLLTRLIDIAVARRR